MRIQNIFYKINTYNLKNINIGIDITYLKDEKIKLKHSQFYSFSKLLNQNKAIKKGSGRKLSIKDIKKITTMSKSSYYRIKKELKIKSSTYW